MAMTGISGLTAVLSSMPGCGLVVGVMVRRDSNGEPKSVMVKSSELFVGSL